MNFFKKNGIHPNLLPLNRPCTEAEHKQKINK